MTSPTRRVGVVILNWKRPQDTFACLLSLARVTSPPIEIIVVDNGSTNGSVQALRRQFPSITVIENGRNLGYAAGCNVGIREVMRRGLDYVLLLNDDAQVERDTLRVLVEAAEADAQIGMVGPTIYYSRDREVVWSAGGRIDWLGRASHPNADGPLPANLPLVCDTDYASGCVLLVRRAVVERVGQLDERFFAYYEEAEWCARAQRAGYRVAYVPRARAWHRVEPHTRGESPMYLYLMARNRLLYLRATGAPIHTVALAIAETLRTSLAWSWRPRHRERRPYAGLLRQAIRDFTIGSFGPPPTSSWMQAG